MSTTGAPTARVIAVDGLSATPGDHICVFYRGEAERRRIMDPFLRDGVRAGDKCVCITAAADHRRIRREVLVDGPEPREADLLCLEEYDDTYTKGGTFDADHMLAYWQQWGEQTFEVEGRLFGRTVSDMRWAHGLFSAPVIDDFMAYEVHATRFARAYPAVAMCLYDLDHFGGNVIIPALRVHPKVLFAGMLLENPYFVDPDELPA